MIDATTFLRQVKGGGVKGRAKFRLISDTSGVTAIEYALIAALIAVAAIAAAVPSLKSAANIPPAPKVF